MDTKAAATEFFVQKELCVGCGLCVDACSMEILAMNDPGGPPVIKLMGRESAHIALEIARP